MTIPSIDFSGFALVAPEADVKPSIASAVVTAGALPPSPEAVVRFQAAMAEPLAENARVDRLLTELEPLSLSPLSRSVQTVEGSAPVVVGNGALQTTPSVEQMAGRQLGQLQDLGRAGARPSQVADIHADSVLSGENPARAVIRSEGSPARAIVHSEGTRFCASAFAGGRRSPSISEEAPVRPVGSGPIAPDRPYVKPPVDGALQITPPTGQETVRQAGQSHPLGRAEARPSQRVDVRVDFVHSEGRSARAIVHSGGTCFCAPVVAGGGQLPSIPEASPVRPVGPVVPDQPLPASNVEVRPASNVEFPPASGVEVRPASNVEFPPASGVEVRPALNVEVRPASGVEVRPASNVEFPPASGVEVPPASNVEVRPVPNVKVPPALDVEVQPDAERLVAAGMMPHVEVVSPGVAPVQTAAEVAPIAALSARAMPRQMDVLVEAATAVADTLLVSPGLLRGEGDILVQLKPDVLEGSQIRIAVTGQVFDVAFQPATPALAEILSAHLPELQQQLAISLPAYHFNVKVAGSARVAGRKVEA